MGDSDKFGLVLGEHKFWRNKGLKLLPSAVGEVGFEHRFTDVEQLDEGESGKDLMLVAGLNRWCNCIMEGLELGDSFASLANFDSALK